MKSNAKYSRNRILSWILMLALVLTLLPEGAFCVTVRAEEEGVKTRGDGILIHPTVSQNGWKYGEEAVPPSVSGNEGGAEVAYTYYTDAACSIKTTEENSGAASEGGVPKDAGTYYLKAVIPAVGLYASGEATASFTIEKVGASVKTKPAAFDPLLEYSPYCLRALLRAGSSDEGTMVYSLQKDGPYSAYMPMGKEAKEYVVWFKVTGDKNHTDSEPEAVITRIEKGKKVEADLDKKRYVAFSCDTVSKVYLPKAWIWSPEDRDKELPVGEPLEAVAIYNSEDAANYTDEARARSVTITRYECYHRYTRKENEKIASCAQDGYTGDVVCTECGETISRGSVIPKPAHEKFNTVRENEVPATCLADGSFDEVVRCADCDALISSKHCTEEALGHSFSFPGYVWSEDGKKCVATVTCLRKDCPADAQGHTVTEEATITAKVLVYPTKTAPGITRYTAVFQGKFFTTQVKDVPDIAKLPGAYSAAGVTAGGSLKAGDRFTAKKAGAELVLLSLEGDKPAAAYAGPVNTKLKNISVPLVITEEGITYEVTGVEDQAFHDCKKAKEIIIGRNVEKLGRNLFRGNKKLRSIIILSTKLSAGSVAKDTFIGVGPKVKVMVPKEKYRAYKKILKKSGLNKKIRIEAMR